MFKKVLIGFFFLYTILEFSLLIHTLKDNPSGAALFRMALSVFFVWIVLGGWLQRKYLQKNYKKLTTLSSSPILTFTLFATALACIEEMVTTLMTNLAPLFGAARGTSYITASTNFFDVIFFHSVIAFVPMFVTLGYLLKRYAISPFAAFLLYGIVGTFAEMIFSGPATGSSAPYWICIYGLIVYLPAHQFINTERKPFFFIFYPLLVPLIAFSALATIWIPKVLNHPSIHFAPIVLVPTKTTP